jgi:hypothetical protein
VARGKRHSSPRGQPMTGNESVTVTMAVRIEGVAEIETVGETMKSFWCHV